MARLVKILRRNRHLIGVFVLINVLVLSVFSVILFKAFAGASGQENFFQTNSSEGQNITEFLSRHTFEDESAVVPLIVESADPAVVSIGASQILSDSGNEDAGISEFFNLFFSEQKDGRNVEVGGGSGFIVSPEGLVVTNRHVVREENFKYYVFLSDGRKFNAEVIARDPLIDLAILKIESVEKFPFLSFGQSSDLKLGETVIAIGNALGEFRNSVSVGVVSGLSRTVVAGDNRGGTELLEEVIQTDAAINFGNSGGPLINTKGEVVGVNVARIFGGENIGFALPSNIVKKVVDSVREHGTIVYPFLGVRYVQVDEDFKLLHNLPVDYGFWVVPGKGETSSAVVSGSPAEKAGIKEGDIIVALNGLELNEASSSLGLLLREKEIGDKVRLDILRQGRRISVLLELGRSP